MVYVRCHHLLVRPQSGLRLTVIGKIDALNDCLQSTNESVLTSVVFPGPQPSSAGARTPARNHHMDICQHQEVASAGQPHQFLVPVYCTQVA